MQIGEKHTPLTISPIELSTHVYFDVLILIPLTDVFYRKIQAKDGGI